jgi:hypothetical protein
MGATRDERLLVVGHRSYKAWGVPNPGGLRAVNFTINRLRIDGLKTDPEKTGGRAVRIYFTNCVGIHALLIRVRYVLYRGF